MSEIIKIANSSNAFLEEVEKISGEKVTKCIQCGICSASCPMADGMDHTPSQIMYLVQMDQEKLIGSDTIWRCSACLSCKARCPRGIDLAKVAE
ncbi:4Fe-4S dicluster domain-containing protein, partial [bacterium]|nr:4Fe-4S dicluster domain-containing protein [bacterium]